MKITQKILENIIKEEIEKAGANDPMRKNRTFAPPLRSEIEQEPVAGYIMQMLHPWMEESQGELEDLAQRVKELEDNNNNNVAPFPSEDTLRKENKKRKHSMKNTQKTLKKIIKEEIAKVLKERFQPSSDDPPHKVNAIRIQELEGKLAHQAGEIDQLYGLIEEYLLTPKGIAISRAAK